VQFFQQEIRNLQKSLADAQARFASTNEELARLSSELAASRREVIGLEGTKGQLAAAMEKLTAALLERDATKAELAAEKNRAEGLAGQLIAQGEELRLIGDQLRWKDAELAAAVAREETVELMHARFDQRFAEQLGRLAPQQSAQAKRR